MATLVATAAGCSGGDFVSDNPGQDAGGREVDLGGEGDVGANTSAATGGVSDPAAPPPDPNRLIAEADIVQIKEDRLYALSAYSGLSIIDVANPDAPTLLGRLELRGEPFEMYVENGVVLAMFTNWGHQEVLEDGYSQWVTSSHVAALDVSDPAAIRPLAAFHLAGDIVDSRKVGDVLYTVTRRYDACWSCNEGPEVSVDSFLVDDPAAPIAVDHLALPNPDYAWGWDRSISVSADRIFIGGAEGSSGGSRIDVVDISDPAGDLVAGTSVRVAGQITSRWQMDEFEGVLRVVSQPWTTSIYPKVQTFTIASSQSLIPLGQTEVVTPVPESLRATRFDGPRAYAITAERTDPLFTIDLSDPANPRVVGQLEIPGWVYHIEPRGDRLLALGFDQDNPAGGLNVSLFDVSVPSAPTLRKRVAFGGDFGNFAEDQDRVHKSFEILPERELLLVPFSSNRWDDFGCDRYESGVQLIDWKNDDLQLRGLAEVRGEPRRAFIHRDRLFALSDEQLRGFDFQNRDLLEKTSELSLAVVVSQVQVVGDVLVRLANDWWTDEPRIEIVPKDRPSDYDVLGTLDLGPVLAEVQKGEACYGWSGWGARMFAQGDQLYLAWPSWEGDRTRIAVVDLSDPTAPRVRSQADVRGVAQSGGSYYGYYDYAYGYGNVIASGKDIVQIGSALAIHSVTYAEYDDRDDERVPEARARVRVVDLSDPDAPKVSAAVNLPDSMGTTGLVVRDGELFASRWESASSDGSKVRFYVDRIDVSDPREPALEASINVPGSLVGFDAKSGRAVLVDYRKEVVDVTRDACWQRQDASFEITDENDLEDYADDEGECRVLHRTLRLVSIKGDAVTLLDELPIAAGGAQNLVVGEDRLFFTTIDYRADGPDAAPRVHVIAGLEGDALVESIITLKDMWWAEPAAVVGQTLVAYGSPGAVVIVDTSEPTVPSVRKIGELPYSPSSIDVTEDRVFVSMGEHGVTSVALD